MNILMVTNTFTPHVGGVARSVEGFTARYRALGHRVLVAAPTFPGAPAEEQDVIRLRAIQNFNGSDFSVPLPITGLLSKALQRFVPDIVHSHHPFLLGDTALRVAANEDIPIVFTHHTMYEAYTHYVPGDSPRLRRFAIDLATGYCDLCDAVIAPSQSIAEILRRRGVTVDIDVIPTGVDVEFFSAGDGRAFRKAHGIPADALVVGHVGRLAPEKNLEFLTGALVTFARQQASSYILVVGAGPCRSLLEETFSRQGLRNRLVLTGALQRDSLPGAYRAMDVFAFASRTETQGMVLTESMAAGVPPVAIDAPGAREVIRDRYNGRLLPAEDADEFVSALQGLALCTDPERVELQRGVAETARRFSMTATADQALALYERVGTAYRSSRPGPEDSAWETAQRRLAEEWRIFAHRAEALSRVWRDPEEEAPDS